MSSSILSLAPGSELELAAPDTKETIAAYAALAEEYDGVEHRTTRELERLSCLSLAEAPMDEVLGRPNPFVIELGCGTGAFTIELARHMQAGRLLITDPVAPMVHRAINRVSAVAAADGPSLVPLRATAGEALAKTAIDPDLVAAGLADPYLTDSLLHAAVRVARPGMRLLITVPTRRWATDERLKRLQIPLQETRFRIADGRTVHSRSLTLDPDQLAELISSSGFDVIASGEIQSSITGWNPRPGISWILGVFPGPGHVSRD